MGTNAGSVIVPAYGRGALLGDAIRSVLDQTYPRFKLIVINDASAVLLVLLVICRDDIAFSAAAWLWLPLIVATQLALMLGLGLFASTLNVFSVTSAT